MDGRAEALVGNESSAETEEDLRLLDGYYFLWNLSDAAVENATNVTNATLFIVDSLFPSGYSLPHIVLASIVVTMLMIVVVVGNMLVIIAIATEKALKNIQNWFIASLAVADFFLGLVIMPFSLANEIMGYWIFGNWWCDVHSAMDVLLCTASIMNLCLISLDRYWSITQAVDYLKKRTPLRAAVMITLVWIMSGLICIPPLLGWKVDRPIEDFPKCQLSEDIGYVLYSALGSFYIPSCIMVFVYIRIYYAAKARARRGIRKAPRRNPPDDKCTISTSFTTAAAGATADQSSAGGASGSRLVVQGGVTLEQPIATIAGGQQAGAGPPPMAIPIVTCDLASDLSTSDHNPENEATSPPGAGPQQAACYLQAPGKDTLKVSRLSACRLSGSTLSVNGDVAASASARCRAPSVGIDADMVSEFDPSSSDSGVVSRCAVVKPLKLRLCQPIFGGRRAKAATNKRPGVEVVPPQKPRDPEREKRRLARKKEKRATLILGLIMGSFIACWLPFFFLYILTPLCPQCNIPDSAFATAFWLGYTNSALNPVIYTIFNKDFRRAFRRILFK